MTESEKKVLSIIDRSTDMDSRRIRRGRPA